MEIPSKIQIGGHEIKVVMKQDLVEHSEAYGMWDLDKMSIYLDKSLSDSLAWETFWHEVIEALNHFAEAEMEHKTIQTFGVLLHQVFVSGFQKKSSGKGAKKKG